MPPFTSSIAKYGATVVGVTVPEAPTPAVQPEGTSTPVVPGGHAAAEGRGGGGGERGDREAE